VPMIAMLSRTAAVGAALAAAVMLGACAPGEIALEGKLFQAVGSAIGVGGSEKEAKLAPRSGLVLPPALNNNLPAPSDGVVPDGQVAEIRDYDASKKVDKAKLAAAQKEFCQANYELPKARGDQAVETVEGPAGPCRPSIFNSLAKWNTGEE